MSNNLIGFQSAAVWLWRSRWWRWLGLAGVLARPAAAQTPAPIPPTYQADFDLLWETVRDNYAYFDRKQTDWNLVRTVYRPQTDTMRTRRAFVRLLEQVFDELYDNHATLNTNRPDSHRLVFSGTDIAAEWVGGRAHVLDVRRGFGAARVGVHPGEELTALDGVPLEQAMQPWQPRCLRHPDPAADNFALNKVLAGNHFTPRHLTLATAHGTRTVEPDKGGSQLENIRYATRLTVARYGQLGYLKINNSLGDGKLIADFDSALTALRDTQGLVLDLRETPNGGNTSVARALLGRFLTREQPYQKHEQPAEARETGIRRSWLELVSPRLPTYTAPLVVLAGYWTGSMGEGLTIGFAAAGRATVVGTPLSRLLGAVEGYTLPHSGIRFTLPFERLYLVSGQPREDYVPAVRLNPAAPVPPGPTSDSALNTGLALLEAPKAISGHTAKSHLKSSLHR